MSWLAQVPGTWPTEPLTIDAGGTDWVALGVSLFVGVVSPVVAIAVVWWSNSNQRDLWKKQNDAEEKRLSDARAHDYELTVWNEKRRLYRSSLVTVRAA